MTPLRDSFAYELLNALPMVVMIVSGREQIRFVNEAGCKVLGYSKLEIEGASYRDFMPRRSAAGLRATLSKLGRNHLDSADFTHSFIRSDGSSLVFQTRVAPFSTQKIPEGHLILSLDVTEKKRAHEKSELFSRAVEQIDESLLITNREGVIEYVNRAFEEITGYGKEEVLGKTPAILKSGMHQPEFYEKMWELILSGQSFHEVMINKKKDGSIYYEDKTVSPIRNDEGVILHHVATGRDVTNRRLAEEKLIEGMERFALSMKGANDGLWDWDFRSGRVFYSRRWKEMLGLDDSEVGNTVKDWFKLVHPEDLGELKAQIRAHVAGETHTLEYEYRIMHKQGGYLWVIVRGLAVKDADKTTYRMAGFQSDITNRKMVEEQLQHDALHDALTGLPNRMLFLDRLGMAIERARRNTEYRFSVYFLDLDRFKIINDSMGHHAGDQMLIEAGNRIRTCLRSSDTLARLGGDEFALLMEGIYDKQECTESADRILTELRKPFNIMGREVYSSASIGITCHRQEYSNPSDVIRDADAAMYRAKKMGRNRMAHFDQTMYVEAVSLLEMETDLRRALEEKKFTVHYQPMVSLKTGEIWGFECFLRWHHPHRGWVPPLDFLPAAEQHGLIQHLGDLVFCQAGKHLASLKNLKNGNRTPLLSVNLSSTQFIQPDLITEITAKMRRYDLPSDSLKLEVKEAILSEYPVQAETNMNKLKRENVSVIIDDFGTGMSSLRNLKRYPIEKIKIDSSFVEKICKEEDARDIVKSTIMMAHSLNIGVIAKSVEKREQAVLLAEMGCDHAQGYFFSRPMDKISCLQFSLAPPQWNVVKN